MTILPFLYLIFMLGVLPDNVPVQYGVDGNIRSWGSKYTLFVLPIVGVLTTLIFTGSGVLCKKIASNEKEKKDAIRNQKLLNYIGLIFAIIMNLYTLISLLNAYYISNLKVASVPFNTIQIACICVGVIFIFIGIIITKAKKNALIGLRTKQSMKDDQAWERSQRMMKLMLIIGGVVLIIGSFFLHGIGLLLLLIVTSIATPILGIILSRIVKR